MGRVLQRVLVVDDEPKIVEVVESYLRKAGFDPLTAAGGEEALRLFEKERPALVILDLMLPDLSGEEVCRRLRARSRVPVIMLTAKVEDSDAVTGLGLGADDYITKPFSPKQLVARVQAVLRRSADTGSPTAGVLSFNDDDLLIDAAAATVQRAGVQVSLTPREFHLLRLLAGNPGRVFTRDELISFAFGVDFGGSDRTIDAHVKNLRQKIETDLKVPRYIHRSRNRLPVQHRGIIVTWSLRTRLTLSYVLVALLCVLMMSVLANGALESSFRRYVRESQARQVEQLVAQIGAQHTLVGGWDDAGMTAIGMSALEQGMIVKVTALDGRTVWDATVHNNGLCVQMITHMARNMASRYPNWRGSYTENIYGVRSSFANVGVVTIGYYGPFFLNDQELGFINSLNLLLLCVMLGAMALAVLIGSLSARRITLPLARVARATQRIAQGHRDVIIGEKTRVRELDGIASSVNDLSRALGDQEALRRRLTADMAHELRPPLATLQSHLEALIDGVWQPDIARLKGLHEESLRINRLVADLEKLAHFEGDDGGLNRRVTDIGVLVAGIVSNHEPQFHEKKITLRFVAREGKAVLPASVDPDKISQAVINLLSSALKFTASGGRVEVHVWPRDEFVEIGVADTGIGIGEDDLPRVFERFYRADSSRSRSTGGAGIGLSIAKAIVDAHGGTISVISDLGNGSDFRIILPRGPAA